MTKNRDVVVVLGMHRSGTSAITRGLNVLGYDLGRTLMAPSDVDNPTGFWENQRIYEAQEQVLTQMGTSWASVRPIAEEALKGYRETFRNLMEPVLQSEFVDSQQWAFKDPRTALLLPLWRDFLESPGTRVRYLIVVRNPLSVAASLETRNGFDRQKAFVLWLEHTLAALAGTSDAERLVVDYDLFLDDPAKGLETLRSFLGLPETDTADPDVADYLDRFLRKSLRHSRFSARALSQDDMTPRSAKQLYRALRSCADGRASASSSSLEQLTRRLSRELEDVAPVLDLMATLEQMLERRGTETEELTTQNEQLTSRLTKADQHAAALERELAAANAELQTARNERESSAGLAAEASRQVEQARLEAERHRTALSEANALTESQRSTIQVLKGRVDTLNGKLESFQAEFQRAKEERAQLTSDLSATTSEQRDAQLRLAEAEAELASAQARIDVLSGEATDAIAALEEASRRIGEVEQRRRDAEAARESLEARKRITQTELESAAAELAMAASRIERLELDCADLRSDKVTLTSEAGELRNALADSHAGLEEACLEIERMRAHAGELEGKQRRSQAEVDRQRDTIRALQAAIEAHRSSHSWRITAPLRACSRLLRGRHPATSGIRGLGGRVVRGIAGMIPMGPRQRVKGLLYRVAPALFRGTASYALWREMHGRRQVPRKSTPAAGDRIRVPCHPSPRATVIVPAYNKFELSQACVRSVVENAGIDDYEVILADDASSDDTREAKRLLPGVRHVRQPDNLGFLGNCNAAARSARGKYIVFLNNDTQVQPGWLAHLVDLAERRPDAGVIGSKLLFEDGRLQEAGGIVWSDGSAWNFGRGDDPDRPEYNYVKPVDYVSGASLLVDAELWRELGGFDTRFVPAYCEDMDLCFQTREAGRSVLYQPASVVVHMEGASHGTSESSGIKRYQVENQKRALEKWREVLERDHFPNGTAVFVARDRSSGSRRALLVDHYVPHVDQDAGSRTTYAFARTLVDLGYTVHFIGDNFYRHEPYTEMLQQLGIEVLYGPHYAQNWQTWWRDHGGYFDLALLNRPHIACKYVEPLKTAHPDVHLVYYGHDLHALRDLREQGETFDSVDDLRQSDWFEVERGLFNSADVVLTCSSVEQTIIEQIAPDVPVQLIPAYVFEQQDREPYDPSTRSGILFVGGFGHAPNADGIVWFVREVLGADAGQLEQDVFIVGSKPTTEVMALAGEQVHVEGFVDDAELARLYNRCRVAIVPLRFGAGVKGKLVEALSWGVPVLTTTIGAEGLPDIDDAVVIADDADEFAARLTELCSDDQRCLSLSAAGHRYATTHFSAEAATRAMQAALLQPGDHGRPAQGGSWNEQVASSL